MGCRVQAANCQGWPQARAKARPPDQDAADCEAGPERTTGHPLKNLGALEGAPEAEKGFT